MDQINSSNAKLKLAVNLKAVEDEEKQRQAEKEEKKKLEKMRLAEEAALSRKKSTEEEAEEEEVRAGITEMRNDPSPANIVKLMTSTAGNFVSNFFKL